MQRFEIVGDFYHVLKRVKNDLCDFAGNFSMEYMLELDVVADVLKNMLVDSCKGVWMKEIHSGIWGSWYFNKEGDAGILSWHALKSAMGDETRVTEEVAIPYFPLQLSEGNVSHWGGLIKPSLWREWTFLNVQSQLVSSWPSVWVGLDYMFDTQLKTFSVAGYDHMPYFQ
jgi:hypothetical protein